MKKLMNPILLACMLFLGMGFVNSAKAAVHSIGTNIISDGTVFMINAEGQRQPYTSAGAFLSYGFNTWGSVVAATTEDLALSVGSFIPPRDGKIVCSDRGSDKGTCYLITNGKRAAFTSEQVFKSLGFDFSKALSGDVSFLESDSNINNTTESHRTGVLVKDKGTIYLVGQDGLMGIPDMATLTSWGYSASDAVVVNSQDQTLSKTQIIQTRQNAALNATDTGAATSTNTSNTTIKQPIVDQCPNLALDQHAIPYGMIKYEDGSCYYLADDICQNIPLFQNSVPEGYFKDTAGSCVENPKPPKPVVIAPVDVCANIEGFQTVIPVGLVNSGGNCVVPGPAPIVPPADTTPPKVTSSGLFSGYLANENITINGQENDSRKGFCGKFCYAFATDEPTTISIYLYPVKDKTDKVLDKYVGMNGDATRLNLQEQFNNKIGDLITLTDNTLRDWHIIPIDMSIQPGFYHRYMVEVIDKSGNKTTESNFNPTEIYW